MDVALLVGNSGDVRAVFDDDRSFASLLRLRVSVQSGV